MGLWDLRLEKDAETDRSVEEDDELPQLLSTLSALQLLVVYVVEQYC